ncbi:hypothetical protein RhiirA4_472787 [Rhizophagus irregularis]|uniref:F-box domain-containing protein n=1 Tax=Rhizophagus irregularis TaxID=588596 RepID=A0A2I1H5I8_9GLOM|nr:hypothetical protein RhiirA4_472787 [Rhizophagus irregularis]
MANKLIKKLLFDCLHEILENLENDITTLHSCLSVNRLLCEISVRILWRVVVEYSVNVTYQPMSIVLKTILINCQYLEFIKIQYGDDFNDLNELVLYNSKFDFVHSRKLLTLTMILSDDFDNEYYEVQRQLCSPVDSIPVDNIPDDILLLILNYKMIFHLYILASLWINRSSDCSIFPMEIYYLSDRKSHVKLYKVIVKKN